MWQYVLQINQTIRVDLIVQLQNLLNKSATSLRGKCDLNCDSCPNTLQSSSHGCLPRRNVLLPKIRRKKDEIVDSIFGHYTLWYSIPRCTRTECITISITFQQWLFIFEVPVVLLLVLLCEGWHFTRMWRHCDILVFIF
jgi:hypothetical protein